MSGNELEREKNPDHVARGLKAAIHNPNVSLDAKVHAVQELEKMGREPPSDSPAQQTAEGGDLNRDNVDREDSEKDSKHKHHVLGGYKATMKNPRTSEEAKQQAEQVLKQHDAL